MHWGFHTPAGVQGKYVICYSKWIQWCWEVYLLWGEIMRLMVEWRGKWVDYCHCYDDVDQFNSCGGRLQLKLSLYASPQTWHIIQTIWTTRCYDLYVSVNEISTARWNPSGLIFHPIWSPFCPYFQKITWMDMDIPLPWRNNKSTIENFQDRSWTIFSPSPSAIDL